MGDGWALDEDGVRRWLVTAIDGISTVQGTFPVDELLVVMQPSGGRGIAFGMVRRGGGHSVGFVVGRESTTEDLETSWVTWHEMSHLFLPPLRQRDAWLYEGIATYYQEVLPARLGIQTETRAWEQLTDGFDRGARLQGGGLVAYPAMASRTALNWRRETASDSSMPFRRTAQPSPSSGS